MSRRRWVAILAVTHFLATVTIFLLDFGMASARFDSGELAGPGGKLVSGLTEVMLFPIAKVGISQHWVQLDGILGWTPVLLNSLLWAVLLEWVIAVLQRRHRGSSRTTVAPTPEAP